MKSKMDKARVKTGCRFANIDTTDNKNWGKLESLDRLECSEVSNLLTVYKLGSIMDVRDAVASRYSCRAFLSAPVSEFVVRDILERSARSPTGGNLQPWHVHALTGVPLEHLKALVRARPELLPRGEGAEYNIYPPKLAEPYETRRRQVGAALYQSIGVTRDDRRGRYRQYARNFEFYNAPVALLIFIDRSMGPPQWSDVGGYIQTIMLLAREHGLHTCGLEAWTHWHKTVYSVLNIPTSLMLFCGMALGYEDPTAPINQWRAPREPFSNYATLSGFDDGNSNMPR